LLLLSGLKDIFTAVTGAAGSDGLSVGTRTGR
jgi:hypothetical protein